VLDTDPEEELRRAGIRIDPLRAGAGARYYFPPAREKAKALWLTGFAALWLGASALIYQAGAPVFFMAILGVFGLLLLLGVLSAWLHWNEVRVQPRHLELRGGMLGYRKIRQWATTEIRDIELVRGSQTQSRLNYQVTVRLADGRVRKAGGTLPDQHLARVFRERLRQTLGLPDQKGGAPEE
jgi:hypothetical protein